MKIYINASKISESLGLRDVVENHYVDLDISDTTRGFSKGDTPWNKGMKGAYSTSEKTKEKLRTANLGKKLSNEHKTKIGEANKISKKGSVPHNKGKTLSKNQRSKINRKTFVLIDSHNNEIKITNMALFCEENGLSKSIMSLLVNGKRSNYKGYVVKLTEDHLGIK